MPLKLVHLFTYLGSDIFSTENDVNIRIGKACTAVDWFMTIYKSDHSATVCMYH